MNEWEEKKKDENKQKNCYDFTYYVKSSVLSHPILIDRRLL